MTQSGKNNGHQDDYTPSKTHEHAGADVYITTDEQSGERTISYGDDIREEIKENEEDEENQQEDNED